MKEIKAIIERNSQGLYSIYMEEAEGLGYGLNATGATEEEAKQNFAEVYTGMQELFLSKGLPFVEVSFNFQRDLVSYLQFYAKRFTLVGLSSITGIHKSQLSHYINETNKPTAKTQERIWKRLCTFFATETAGVA